MSEKNKKTCRALNYFEDFLGFICAVSGCVSISAFASLGGVPVAIVSSAVGLRIYAINVGVNKIWVSSQEKEKKAWSAYYRSFIIESLDRFTY